MIKVLFLIPNLAHGGAERVLVNLVNHMDYSEFDITVQTMFDVGIYRGELNKAVKYIGGFPWYFRGNTLVYKMFSPKMLFKLYIKEEYDVIVSYLEGPSARVVYGASGYSGKRICWVHVEFGEQAYFSKVFRNINEAQECYQSFDRIICVSNTVKQDFQKMVKVDSPVDVLFNTVETDVIQFRADENVDDIVFSENEINIISVAKLMKVKGYDRLARICKRLIENGFPVHVYLIGKGEEQGNLESLVKKLGLGQRFTFVGFRDNPYKYVKKADLYVCSSHMEGFSTAVSEALIIGTPVVSTKCSGAEELLGYNNEYGIVTENDEDALYQGIKKIISEQGLLLHYKKQAAIRGAKFSTEETVKAVERMLKKVASK